MIIKVFIFASILESIGYFGKIANSKFPCSGGIIIIIPFWIFFAVRFLTYARLSYWRVFFHCFIFQVFFNRVYFPICLSTKALHYMHQCPFVCAIYTWKLDVKSILFNTHRLTCFLPHFNYRCSKMLVFSVYFVYNSDKIVLNKSSIVRNKDKIILN